MTDQPRTYLDPLHDELDHLRNQVAAYRDGADDTPRDPSCEMTPAQAWSALLNMTADRRIEVLGVWVQQSSEAARCFLMQHQREIDRMRAQLAQIGENYGTDFGGWKHRLEQAEARVDQLTDQLTLANDTLRHRGDAVNATGHTNDQLRATIARIEKLNPGDLYEAWHEEPWDGCADKAQWFRVVDRIRVVLDDQEPRP